MIKSPMSQTNEGRKRPRKAKKFRTQILHRWIVENFKPGKVADIGGGKGLLAYLLAKEGWDATVIDPEEQLLPSKYTDLNKKKVKIPEEDNEMIKHITAPFEESMAEDFDLLVGLHAHGSNMKIINAAKKYDKDFILIPCCVIDEPIEKQHGINWRESLIDYAKEEGLPVETVKLGFMGKDIALYVKHSH